MSLRLFSSVLVRQKKTKKDEKRRKRTKKDEKGRKKTKRFFFWLEVLFAAENDFNTFSKGWGDHCRFTLLPGASVIPASYLTIRFCSFSNLSVDTLQIHIHMITHLCSQCCFSAASAASLQPLLHLCSQWCISAASATSLQPIFLVCSQCCISAASAASLQLKMHLCSQRCISAASAASLQPVLHLSS